MFCTKLLPRYLRYFLPRLISFQRENSCDDIRFFFFCGRIFFFFPLVFAPWRRWRERWLLGVNRSFKKRFKFFTDILYLKKKKGLLTFFFDIVVCLHAAWECPQGVFLVFVFTDTGILFWTKETSGSGSACVQVHSSWKVFVSSASFWPLRRTDLTHEASANVFQFNKLTPCVKSPLYHHSVSRATLVFMLNSIGCDLVLTNVLRMASCVAIRWKIRLDKILMRADSKSDYLVSEIYLYGTLSFSRDRKKIYYFISSSFCTQCEQFANHPFLKLIEYAFVHGKSLRRSYWSDGNLFSSACSPQKFTI